MKIDPESWLLATAAAGLLLAGGAFLRAAFFVPRLATVSGPTPSTHPEVSASDPEHVKELSQLREQLAAANATKEPQRAEMVELRQRSERQVQGAQAEIQRLATELDAERLRAQSSDEKALVLDQRIAGLELELARARANAPDPKALASLSGEVAELQRKLMVITEDRDKMRAKSEALERLIEGVRARSRELADQVKALKGEAS
jgi:DNA repair exonuclease SbcCD ATPase subunit